MSKKEKKQESESLDNPWGIIFYRLHNWITYKLGITERYYKKSVSEGMLGWRVLRYNRILNPATHFYPVEISQCIRPETFKVQMAYLANHCNVISLKELQNHLVRRDEIPPKTVVLTFDNAWMNFYENVFPTLRHHNLPASVFASTAFIGTPDLYWPDKLMLVAISLHRENIALTEIDEEGEIFENIPKGGIEELVPYINRISQLIDRLKLMDPETREQILQKFYSKTDKLKQFITKPEFVTWEQIKEMSQHKIDFGSQGHSHSTYNEVNPSVINFDITMSYKVLKKHGVDFLKTFSYPEGVITKNAKRIAKELKIPFGLISNSFHEPYLENKEHKIINRINLEEHNTFSEELFANYLWTYDTNLKDEN